MVIAALAGALALAGCGGDDDSGNGTGTTTGETDGGGKATGKNGKDGDGKGAPAAPKGPIAEGELNLRPTRGCKKVGFSQGGQFIRGKAAPNPFVAAKLEGDRIVVSYRFLAVPADCRPVGLSVSTNSLKKPEAASTPRGAGEDGLVRARRSGKVVLPVPKGGEEPYQVQMSSITRKDIASDTTTIPVQ
ncbi:MAG: hypothetical protein WD649_05440 [Thermoleophilaceae bacterium]